MLLLLSVTLTGGQSRSKIASTLFARLDRTTERLRLVGVWGCVFGGSVQTTTPQIHLNYRSVRVYFQNLAFHDEPKDPNRDSIASRLATNHSHEGSPKPDPSIRSVKIQLSSLH